MLQKPLCRKYFEEETLFGRKCFVRNRYERKNFVGKHINIMHFVLNRKVKKVKKVGYGKIFSFKKWLKHK